MAKLENSNGGKRTLSILGVPFDLGQRRRGVDMGPSTVRVAGLQARLTNLGYSVSDSGNITVGIAETRDAGCEKARYLAEITGICDRVAASVLEMLGEGATPIVLGGDHSVAAGTAAGTAQYFHQKNAAIGLIWIDAHADINTPETTPSGNVHGMPVAALLGLGPRELSGIFGWQPKVAARNMVYVGVRDIDGAERANIRKAGVTEIYTMRDIDEMGMRAVMERATQAAAAGTAGYHVSMDMDWVDPVEAPGVGTPVRGGATYREAHLAMEILADHGGMLSFELAEVNPVLDERNRTADLAVELICSAFGKKIL
jgi:arginase